ncbi:hypothetical protein [Salidesulfovibrio onnuriiensis]|uniref:hypothetical protein n=1 Tax=Salidesulfovibrio onnuriiensis TaxID=2583823 RepID=UPI0011CA13F1|nr:hypothetical protein [Salidesulfovibrio onnuriiensis]
MGSFFKSFLKVIGYVSGILGVMSVGYCSYPTLNPCPSATVVETKDNEISRLKLVEKDYSTLEKKYESVHARNGKLLDLSNEYAKTIKDLKSKLASYGEQDLHYRIIKSEDTNILNGTERKYDNGKVVIRIQSCYTAGGMDMKTPLVQGYFYSTIDGPRKEFTETIGSPFFYKDYRFVATSISNVDVNLSVSRGTYEP